jgi:hypothetical protein
MSYFHKKGVLLAKQRRERPFLLLTTFSGQILLHGDLHRLVVAGLGIHKHRSFALLLLLQQLYRPACYPFFWLSEQSKSGKSIQSKGTIRSIASDLCKLLKEAGTLSKGEK